MTRVEDARGGRLANDPTSRRLLDVRLSPHRSLTPENARVMMLLFSGIGILVSLPFLALGAWPVAGFMGVDVVILTIAFKANLNAARAYEHLVVTPLELLLAKVNPRGARCEFRFHPAWVRLMKEEHEEFGIQRLSLRSRGRCVELAPFLGPAAKAQLAKGLTAALNEARRGPRFP